MKTPRIPWCKNCDKRIGFLSGLCNACHQWQRKHAGAPRPRRFWDAERTFSFCDDCGDFAVIGPHCRACYQYRQRHNGKRRPKRLRENERPVCTICARPLIANSRRHAKSGYCGACYHYLQRTGHDRPQRLIQRKAPLGWCDGCARPAHRIETTKISSTYTLTLRICKACDGA